MGRRGGTGKSNYRVGVEGLLPTPPLIGDAPLQIFGERRCGPSPQTRPDAPRSGDIFAPCHGATSCTHRTAPSRHRPCTGWVVAGCSRFPAAA